ncbi:MAG: TolC family protein [Desulfobacteraceae bacterium]|nr:TolC family protein [Desulfobacteraceae bacterium]MBC2720536.1 TolC family protein [Desulfobacteraceae bacterium]
MACTMYRESIWYQKQIKFKSSLSFLLVTCGCFSHDKYTYESIRQEYAKVICDDAFSTKVSKTGQYTCALHEPVSLNDAIQIALANNPDNKIAVARIKQAEAMIEKADANFFPSIGFYTEYSQGDAPSRYLFKKIDQRLLPANTDFNSPGWYENFLTTQISCERNDLPATLTG